MKWLTNHDIYDTYWIGTVVGICNKKYVSAFTMSGYLKYLAFTCFSVYLGQILCLCEKRGLAWYDMYIMLGANNPQYVLQETGFASICNQKAHPVFYTDMGSYQPHQQ